MMALPEWVDLPRRKNPRARGFDYATPGMYMLTQCVQKRIPLLGIVNDGQMQLSAIGGMVRRVLFDTAARFLDTTIDCCIMPDHLHLVLALSLETGRKGTSVPDFVRVFKSVSTVEYIHIRRDYPRLPERRWQRSYGDEVIEDEEELYAYRKYILENPLAHQLKRDGLL